MLVADCKSKFILPGAVALDAMTPIDDPVGIVNVIEEVTVNHVVPPVLVKFIGNVVPLPLVNVIVFEDIDAVVIELVASDDVKANDALVANDDVIALDEVTLNVSVAALYENEVLSMYG